MIRSFIINNYLAREFFKVIINISLTFFCLGFIINLFDLGGKKLLEKQKREAEEKWEQTWEHNFDILKNMMKDEKLRVIIHCFTGNKDFAEKLIKIGCYISISGIITFKNSYKLQETFKNIPNEKLLVETDSPFLSPVPMRGKENEPSYIIYTLKKLAELKNISEEEIINITTNNFEKIFKK